MSIIYIFPCWKYLLWNFINFYVFRKKKIKKLKYSLVFLFLFQQKFPPHYTFTLIVTWSWCGNFYTEGSVILTVVLLKLGTYGFIRFSILILAKAAFYYIYSFSLFYCALVSVIYTSFTEIGQTDFKRIIELIPSIAHINLVEYFRDF